MGGKSGLKEEEKKKAGAFLKRWLLTGQGKQRDESETAREKNLVGGRKEETQVRDMGQMNEEKEIKKEEGGEEETVSVKELIGRIENNSEN